MLALLSKRDLHMQSRGSNRRKCDLEAVTLQLPKITRCSRISYYFSEVVALGLQK